MPSLQAWNQNSRISRGYRALGDHLAYPLLDRGGNWGGKGDGLAKVTQLKVIHQAGGL